MNHDDAGHHRDSAGLWRSRYGVGLLVLGAVAAWLLLSEHRVHALGALPYLVLLACPLMHVFMHRGHGSHGGRGRDRSPDDGASSTRDGPGETS